MAFIKTKKLQFVSPQPDTAIKEFNVYSKLASEGDIDYATSFIVVPKVAGKTDPYEVILPNDIPGLTTGNWNFGVGSVGTNGNISDISTTTATLDFTVPAAPTGVQVV